MRWRSFARRACFGIAALAFGAGLYSCGLAVVPTPTPALTPQRVIQGFRDAGLRVEVGSQNDTYNCVKQPGVIAWQAFGTSWPNTTANVIASFETPAQAEVARAACTNTLLAGFRRDATILVMIDTGAARGTYQPYFTVLQALR